MKKILFVSLLFLAAQGIKAQGFDAKAIASQVLAKLIPSLAITDEQQPQVSDAVVDFLNSKAPIIPLQKTDPSAYVSKFNALNGTLIGKLKTILTAKQMTTFLGLRPKATDTGNVLTHLFY